MSGERERLEDATDGLPRAFAPDDADRDAYEAWQALGRSLEAETARLPALDAERIAQGILRRKRVRRSAAVGRWAAMAAVLVVGIGVAFAVKFWPVQHAEDIVRTPISAQNLAWDDDADERLAELDAQVAVVEWTFAHDRPTFSAFEFDLEALWERYGRFLELL